MTNKIKLFWKDFIKRYPEFKNKTIPKAAYFCNNEKDANQLAELVLQGKKKATCGALISYQKEKEAIVKIGDLWIVTDFLGNPKCVTKTINVFHIKFGDVTQEIAAKEGEGDLSLSYWQNVHWKFFTEDLKKYNLKPSLDMVLVFDEFETYK